MATPRALDILPSLLAVLLAGGCNSAHGSRTIALGDRGRGAASISVPRDAVRVSMSPNYAALPIVPVTIDGKSAAFVLDTGAETTLITPAAAGRLGLSLVASDHKSYDAHGAVRRVLGIASLKEIRLADAPLRDQQAWCMDLPLPSGVDGLLSRDAFADLVLAIDYPKRVVEVWKGELPPPDGSRVLPVGVHSANAVRIPLTLDGVESWFMVDTGFGGQLLLDRELIGRVRSQEVAQRRHSQGVNSRIETQSRRLADPVIIGTQSFAHVVATHFPGARNMIGSGLLQNHRIIIDQKRRRFAIEPSAKPS